MYGRSLPPAIGRTALLILLGVHFRFGATSGDGSAVSRRSVDDEDEMAHSHGPNAPLSSPPSSSASALGTRVDRNGYQAFLTRTLDNVAELGGGERGAVLCNDGSPAK